MSSWEDVDYHWRHARAGHCYYHLAEELMVYRFYTGSRRDSGLQNHKNLVQYLTEKYAKDGDIVGCRGGPGCRGAAPRAPAAAPTAGAFAKMKSSRATTDTPGTDGDFVKVKYVLPKRGSHDVIGSKTLNPRKGGQIKYGPRPACAEL